MKQNIKRIIAALMCITMIFGLCQNISVKAAEKVLKVWATVNEQPVDIVEKGTTVTFKYQYGESALSCQARILVKTADGKEVLSKVNSSSAGLCEVKLDEDTDYTIIVKIFEGASMSASGDFTVNSVVGLPVITKQPSDIKCYEYTNAKFEVDCNNSAATYQWYKTSDITQKGEIISGASSKTYSIPDKNVTLNLNNTYFYCVVSANGYSVKSYYAKLNVFNLDYPETTTSPTKTEVPAVTPGETKSPDQTTSPGTPEVTNVPGIVTPTNTPDNTQNTQTPTQTAAPTTTTPNNVTATSAPSKDDNKKKVSKDAEETPSSLSCKYTASFNAAKKNVVIKLTKLDKSSKWTLKRAKSAKGKYTVVKQGKGSSTITDNRYIKNKTYYQLVISNGKEQKTHLFSVNTSATPKLKSFKTSKKGRTIYIQWKFDNSKMVEVHINTGNGWKKLGKKSGKDSVAKIKIPEGYTSVGIKIRGYNKVGKKKYYSAFSKPVVKKL